MLIMIYICFKLNNQPAAGGNNFLKTLSKTLQEQGVLTSSPEDADIILFNSHHQVKFN